MKLLVAVITCLLVLFVRSLGRFQSRVTTRSPAPAPFALLGPLPARRGYSSGGTERRCRLADTSVRGEGRPDTRSQVSGHAGEAGPAAHGTWWRREVRRYGRCPSGNPNEPVLVGMSQELGLSLVGDGGGGVRGGIHDVLLGRTRTGTLTVPVRV